MQGYECKLSVLCMCSERTCICCKRTCILPYVNLLLCQNEQNQAVHPPPTQPVTCATLSLDNFSHGFVGNPSMYMFGSERMPVAKSESEDTLRTMGQLQPWLCGKSWHVYVRIFAIMSERTESDCSSHSVRGQNV